MLKRDWEKRYRDGDLPWDVGQPDPHLKHVLEEYHIAPCRTLEIGLGTGTNALWMAKQGFTVSGIDIAPTAVEMARAKIEAAGASADLMQGDVLKAEIPAGPFGFVFDRGCFHSFDAPEDRKRFAEVVAAHLDEGGMWFSKIGSADSPPREVGPPRRSATDIVTAVEEHLCIICLEATTLNPANPDSPPGWACLMRKR